MNKTKYASLNMEGLNREIGLLVSALLSADHKSTSPLTHRKTDLALANIKRARTYLEKAHSTLIWSDYQNRLAAVNGKTLCEVFTSKA